MPDLVNFIHAFPAIVLIIPASCHVLIRQSLFGNQCRLLDVGFPGEALFRPLFINARKIDVLCFDRNYSVRLLRQHVTGQCTGALGPAKPPSQKQMIMRTGRTITRGLE